MYNMYKIKKIVFFGIYALCYYPLTAQESIFRAYKQSFVRVDLAGKAGVLRDAALDGSAGEFMARLCGFALDYALWNGEIMADDADMIDLISVAARGASAFDHTDSAETLWELFAIYGDVLTRVEILDALRVLGRGNIRIVDDLNQFLMEQNAVFRPDMTLEYPVIRAAVSAVGSLGNASSYPILFAMLSLDYSEEIIRTATAGLYDIRGDFKRFLMDVIQVNPAADAQPLSTEKLIAFRLGMGSEELTEADKGELAQAALEVGLGDGGTDAALADLRYQSVRILTDLKWVRASETAIKHFYRVQNDYADVAATKKQFIEAVGFLGAMGSTDAARVLALQLGLLNFQVEHETTHDEDVIIAFVNALGEIGDKLAFDDLLRIRDYLDYSEKVKRAAHISLSKLKW
ncbi:MAG: hypothetical protein LBI40_02560 [Treponema sp.]|nr:hypothetical protein [Treponema sp.]